MMIFCFLNLFGALFDFLKIFVSLIFEMSMIKFDWIIYLIFFLIAKFGSINLFLKKIVSVHGHC